ncbi:MAG TPA: HepT-like ribonuclease domain-containing protein [Methanoregula sp.]|nr:HepT-like ribonuclease domain-containing protein [Methanoregula sp.]
MRHLLVHRYFGIDLDEIWNTAKNDLPKLKEEILHVLPKT